MKTFRVELFVEGKMQLAFEVLITPLMADYIAKNQDKAGFKYGIIQERQLKQVEDGSVVEKVQE